VVTLDGRDHYLGKFGSTVSEARYKALLAEWLTVGGAPRPREGAARPTVVELLAAYWKYAEQHYRDRDGEPSKELLNLRDALRPLRQLYGHHPADAFGPLALHAVREEMIRSGLARTTINWRVDRIRRLFKWAAGRELIPVAVHAALKAVEGLRQGRTEARESDPVRPVPVEHVEAVLPHLP